MTANERTLLKDAIFPDKEKDKWNGIISRLFEDGAVICTFKGKYSSENFTCLHPDELKDVALYILWRRWHSGNYFSDPSKPVAPSIPEDQVFSMPNDSIKEAAVMAWQNYRSEIRHYEQCVFDNARVEYALQNREGLLAYIILVSRSDYEYEYMDVYRLDKFNIPDGDLLNTKPNSDYFL
jgi:hypothetical protein